MTCSNSGSPAVASKLANSSTEQQPDDAEAEDCLNSCIFRILNFKSTSNMMMPYSDRQYLFERPDLGYLQITIFLSCTDNGMMTSGAEHPKFETHTRENHGPVEVPGLW